MGEARAVRGSRVKMAQQVDLIEKVTTLQDLVGNNVSIVKNTANGRYALITNSDDSQCSFSEEYSNNQTNLNIVTPLAGNRLCIHGGYFATDGAAGEIHLDFLASGIKVFRMYPTKTTTTALSTMNVVGGVDEPLTLNTTVGADKKIFILVNYMCET